MIYFFKIIFLNIYSSPRNGEYISLYIIYKIFRKLLESGLTAFLNINYTKWIFKRTWWQHILKTIAIFSIFYGVVGDYSKEHILWIRTYVRRKNRARNRRYNYYHLYIIFCVLSFFLNLFFKIFFYLFYIFYFFCNFFHHFFSFTCTVSCIYVHSRPTFFFLFKFAYCFWDCGA